MNALGRDDGWVWISILASTAAVATGCYGSEGTWYECSPTTPGTRTRVVDGRFQCLCETGWSCNYRQVEDAALYADDAADVGLDDTGFSDAGPIDDAAIDALSTIDVGPADAAGPIEDADALITDDALVSNDVAFAEGSDAP